MWRTLLLAGLVACKPEPEPLDLTEGLGPDEVRSGVVTDEAALFGGIAAEGRVGDVLLYNDRVRFVVQGVRDGSFYLSHAGSVIDADIVRPEGQPGRDAIDEWHGMFGVGRVMDAVVVRVVDDGRSSGRAHVRALGLEAPIDLLTGALEAPDLIPDLGLVIQNDYILEPGSWLLEVRSTVTASEQEVVLAPSDLLLGSADALQNWEPEVGLEAPFDGNRRYAGYVGRWNDIAILVGASTADGVSPGISTVRELLGDVAIAEGETVTIPAGGSITWTRYYGVGPDLATVDAELLERQGIATRPVDGKVTAADGAVAGARVNVLVDGAPYTLAITGEDGTFTAAVPEEAEDVDFLAVGRGPGVHVDAPAGAAPYSPYAGPTAAAAALASQRDGAVEVPVAEGRGVADPADPLVLGTPGRLTVRAADGLPFEARVGFSSSDVDVDDRLVPGRPSGRLAMGWSRDGEITMPVEPGTYDLVVHRGIRYEVHQEEVEVVAGEELVVDVALEAAYEHPGFLLGDPHAHASPSADGGIPMEHRLVVTAGTGVQLHFGTDHDHIADYRPLLAPLGLDGVLASVVSDEVSPVVRGHLNLFPVEPDPDAPNAGAWRWWMNPVERTSDQMEELRSRHPDAVIQANHPMSGIATFAGWSPGVINSPTFWAEFDAVEVNNGGGLAALEFYLDLVARGLVVTPTGVSDTHTYTGGSPGLNGTFIGLGTDDPTAYSDDALREAFASQRTVATRGPFLDLSIAPGSLVEGATTLDVRALSPTWIVVDRLYLLRDGEVVESAEGAEATFTLAPEADASFVVIAEGAQSMAPVYGTTPWALSAAIRVDVDADGWEPPLPPLEE